VDHPRVIPHRLADGRQVEGATRRQLDLSVAHTEVGERALQPVVGAAA